MILPTFSPVPSLPLKMPSGRPICAINSKKLSLIEVHASRIDMSRVNEHFHAGLVNKLI